MAPKVNAEMKKQYVDDSPNSGSSDREIPTTADEPGNTDAGMSASAMGGGDIAGGSNSSSSSSEDKHPSGAPKAYEVQKNSDKYGNVVGNPNESPEEALKTKSKL